MFSNILVGSDGSEQALKAAGVAGDLAKTLGARATLVHVVRPVSPTLGIPGLGVATIDLTGVEEHYWEVAQAILDQTEKAFVDAGGPPPQRMVLSGKPSAAMATYAQEQGIDLIVVGGSGAGLAEFIVGSTTSNICHRASCSVLVVR
jgi:nucleotide-binding universal stress UspA family protein